MAYHGPAVPGCHECLAQKDRINFEEMRRNRSLGKPQRLADVATRVLPRIDGCLDKGWTVSVIRFQFVTCADVRPSRWSRPPRTGRLFVVETTLAAYPKFKTVRHPFESEPSMFQTWPDKLPWIGGGARRYYFAKGIGNPVVRGSRDGMEGLR